MRCCRLLTGAICLQVATINKQPQLEALLTKAAGGAPAAAWKAAVLLLTSKSETVPLYKSLASQYAGKLAFGESRASNKELADKFNISR